MFLAQAAFSLFLIVSFLPILLFLHAGLPSLLAQILTFLFACTRLCRLVLSSVVLTLLVAKIGTPGTAVVMGIFLPISRSALSYCLTSLFPPLVKHVQCSFVAMLQQVLVASRPEETGDAAQHARCLHSGMGCEGGFVLGHIYAAVGRLNITAAGVNLVVSARLAFIAAFRDDHGLVVGTAYTNGRCRGIDLVVVWIVLANPAGN